MLICSGWLIDRPFGRGSGFFGSVGDESCGGANKGDDLSKSSHGFKGQAAGCAGCQAVETRLQIVRSIGARRNAKLCILRAGYVAYLGCFWPVSDWHARSFQFKAQFFAALRD
jgi:hypothetical protein